MGVRARALESSEPNGGKQASTRSSRVLRGQMKLLQLGPGEAGQLAPPDTRSAAGARYRPEASTILHNHGPSLFSPTWPTCSGVEPLPLRDFTQSAFRATSLTVFANTFSVLAASQ